VWGAGRGAQAAWAGGGPAARQQPPKEQLRHGLRPLQPILTHPNPHPQTAALLRRYYASKLQELAAAVDGADGAGDDAGGDAGDAEGGARSHRGGGKAGGGDGDESMEDGETERDATAAATGGGGGGGAGAGGGAALGLGGSGGGGSGGGAGGGFLGLAPPESTRGAADAMGAEWAGRLRCVASCLVALGLEAASEEAYTAVVNRWGAEGRGGRAPVGRAGAYGQRGAEQPCTCRMCL
jgi:hypothetical protein